MSTEDRYVTMAEERAGKAEPERRLALVRHSLYENGRWVEVDPVWREVYFWRGKWEAWCGKVGTVAGDLDDRILVFAEVPTEASQLKKFEVWSEGYRATCEHGRAICHGVFLGCDFRQAVEGFKNSEFCSNPELVDLDKLTYWGCKFFDNEADARKTHG